MAESGYQAGTAWLAVRPSLRGFQSELRRELRGLDLSADVRIRADTSGLRREVDEATRAASRRGGEVRITGNIENLRAAIFEARLQLEELRNARTRVDIDADRSRVRAAIAETRAELANLQNLRTRPEIDADISAASAAIDEVQAELLRLSQMEASPQVDADTAAAQARLQELQDTVRRLDGETARVDVQADINNARTRLDQLRGELRDLDGERADVDVIADIAEAEADLQRMERRLRELDGRRAKIDVDSSGVDAAASSMLRLTTNAVSAASAVALIGSAIPAVAGLAAALTSAAGAAGLIPAAIGAGGAAFGAVKLGLTGISDALDAVGAAEQSAGKDAAAAAQQHAQAAAQIESASLSLQRAERAVGEARKDAAREVAQAETAAAERVAQARQQAAAAAQAVVAAQRAARDAARDVTLAISAQEQAQTDLASRTRDLKFAQDALNGAWVEGKRALQDLQDQADGVALDQRQNALDLKDAAKALNDARAGGNLDTIARAQLAYDRLIEQQDVLAKRSERVNEANAKGQAAGVEGTDQVVAARARIVDADDAVIAAQQRLEQQTYAVGQARERADTAEQALGDARARRSQADAAIDAARVKGAADVALAREMAGRRIRSAEESAADAARALTLAMEQTGVKGSAAAMKLDAAMAKLSPNARSLVQELIRLKPAWDALRMDVQDRLLAGVSGRIGELAGKYLPHLRSMLGGIADGFNLAFHQTTDFLGLKQTVDDLGLAFGRVKSAVSIFAGAVKPLTQIFTDFFIVGSEFLPGLAQGFKDASDRAADFVRNARGTGELKQWIADGIHQIKTFFGILGDVGGIAFTVFDAANTSGIGFLDTVKEATGKVREFLNSDEGQGTLHILFDSLRDTVDNLKPGLLAILGAIKDAIKEIAPKLPGVAGSFSKIASGVAPILKDIAVQVFDAFATAFDLLADVPPDILVGLAGVLTGMVLAKKAIGFAQSFAGIFGAAASPVALAAILGLTALLAAAEGANKWHEATQPIRDKNPADRTTGESFNLAGADAAQSTFHMDDRLGKTTWSSFWAPDIDFQNSPVMKALRDLETFMDGLVGPGFNKWIDDINADWERFFSDPGAWLSQWWEQYISGPIATKWGEFTAWWDGTAAGWSTGWSTFWQGVSDWFGLKWGEIVTWAQTKWGELSTWWTETSTAWGVGWNGFWQGIADWIGLKWGEVVLWAQTKWGELSTWWAETSAAWQIGWNTFWQTIADWISLKWQEIKDWVVLKWTETSTWLTEQIGGFEVWWNDTWSRVAQWFSDRWEDIKRIGSDAWIWLKTNVWDPMVTFVTVDIPNAFQRAVDAIRTQWDRIRGIIGPPVEWLVNTVYNQGIRPVWNAIATKVGLGELPMAVYSGGFNSSGSTAGKSGTNTANRLAAGGKVVGPGTETSDDIPAMLSKNEFVVRAKVAKQAMPFLTALNAGQAEALQAANAGNPVAPMMKRYLAQGGVAGGQAVLNAMRGKPYIWGGSGPGGTDCSGIVAYVQRGMAGEANPYRRIGTTKSMPWGGWAPGLNSALTAGVNGRGASASHMVGNLAGTNFEARQTGTPIMVGGGARGPQQFPVQYSLTSAGGQYVGGGAGGGGVFTIPAWVTEGIAKANALLKGFTNPNAGTGWGAAIGAAGSTLAKAAGQTILDKLNPLNVVSGIAGAVGGALGIGGGSARAQIIAAESGGSYTARNPTSSASGRYQMIDSTWRAYRGSSTAARAYLASPAEQDAAADRYVNARYGGWDGALAFRKTHGWYDEGGVAAGRGIMLKQILEPERVLSPRQNVAFEQLVAHATSGYRGTSQRPIQGAEAWGRGAAKAEALVGTLEQHFHGNNQADEAVQALDHQLRVIRRRV